MKSITVQVTKADIIAGRKGDVSNCAVARAVKRTGAKSVAIDGDIAFKKGGKSYAGTLPAKVQNWIRKFDDLNLEKTSLKPLSFTVKLEDVTIPK
jgi:hypothetical protein